MQRGRKSFSRQQRTQETKKNINLSISILIYAAGSIHFLFRSLWFAQTISKCDRIPEYQHNNYNVQRKYEGVTKKSKMEEAAAKTWWKLKHNGRQLVDDEDEDFDEEAEIDSAVYRIPTTMCVCCSINSCWFGGGSSSFRQCNRCCLPRTGYAAKVSAIDTAWVWVEHFVLIFVSF